MSDRIEYVLVSDDNGHYYVIPAFMEDQWSRWLQDEASIDSDAPMWAKPLNGSPSLLRFTDWRIL